MYATKYRSHLAYYGGITLERRYCTDCKRFAFVIDGKIQCCDAVVKEDSPKVRKRMCDVPNKRKRPGRKDADRILQEQDHRCFWCARIFGKTVWRGQRSTVLRVTWDHVVPFAYSRDNRANNFVASCQVCNAIKSSLMFDSIEEYRVHIGNKRIEKGYTDVRPLRGELRPETPVAKVL